MDLLSRFRQFIADNKLFHPRQKLLLAVSGGRDSIVLCELCRQAKFDFAIAHCNFQLRGAESDEDERFVNELAVALGVDFFSKTFNTEAYAHTHQVSTQVAARELRYDWFGSLLSNAALPYDYLLTAHHADDNVETVMMNFFKGTGIRGLKGIVPQRDKLLRPLLFASGEDIAVFAEQEQLSWREDSSNSSDKYTRNYFRNELIPGLEKVFPQVKQNIQENILRFAEVNEIYDTAIASIKKSLCHISGEEVKIPVNKLLLQKNLNTILFEILRPFHFTVAQLPEVQKLLWADSGKYCASATHRILKDRNWLIISPLQAAGAAHILIESNHSEVKFARGSIRLSTIAVPVKITPDTNLALIDAKHLQFPLLLRPWKQGDYFYPLGMPKKKKLSRFFIDKKLSLVDKEQVWVIESGKKIIWVVGLRIDDRFKITASTTDALQVEWLPV